MGYRQSGFSLIEALISILVFSTGMLGLAQLQARLWSVSGDLHTLGAAYLLANTLVEKSVTLQLFDAEDGETPVPEITQSTATFKTAISLSRTPPSTETDVRVEWTDRSGLHSIQLSTAVEIRPNFTDTRWLLPVR